MPLKKANKDIKRKNVFRFKMAISRKGLDKKWIRDLQHLPKWFVLEPMLSSSMDRYSRRRLASVATWGCKVSGTNIIVDTKPPHTTTKLMMDSWKLSNSNAKMGLKENPNMKPASNNPIPGARNCWGSTSLRADKATATQLTSPVDACIP